MADAYVTLRQGETRPLFGCVSAGSGTVQVQGDDQTPKATLYDSVGAAVSGYDGIECTGWDTSAAASVRVWLLLATGALAAGSYTLVFTIVVLGSDALERTELAAVGITVEAIPSVRFTVYPAATDLQAFLEAAGFALSSGIVALLDAQVGAAIRDLETATDRFFLATAGTRRLNPPTGTQQLLLDQDLASLTSLEYRPGGAGGALVEGTDFTLEPWDAPERRLPYDTVVFADARQWSYPLPLAQRGSLYLTGAWGYAAEIPENAWLAMLARAAWLAAPLLAQGINDGAVEVQQLDTRVKFGDDPLGTQKLVWGGKDGAGGIYGAAVAEFTRQPRTADPAVRDYEVRTAETAPSLFAAVPAGHRSRGRIW